MKLDEELKVLGCDVDPESFRSALAHRFAQDNRDCTPEDLFCRWKDNQRFCEHVRAHFKLGETADTVIAQTILNMRKNSDCFRASRKPAETLKKQLSRAVPSIKEWTFRRVIKEVFAELFRPMTVDQLLVRWRDASRFCGVVSYRLELNRNVESDTIILRTLINMRRASKLTDLATAKRKPA